MLRTVFLREGATSNTMLKHLGVCRAAGGEQPSKERGWERAL